MNDIISTENAATATASNAEVIELLRKQNQLLASIQNDLTKSMERDGLQLNLRSDIVDFNMSIGSMVSLMFKWLIASIPVGIVVGFLYFFVVLFGSI